MWRAGEITLIGATTENPSFEIVAPLLSRMKVLTLSPLTEEEIVIILERALHQDGELRAPPTAVEGNALKEIATLVTGDARKGLNLLEIAHAMAIQKSAARPVIDHETVQEAYQKGCSSTTKKGRCITIS